jgi:general stress protein YciG
MNFYESIGRLGGRKSRGGGFAKNPELARQAGARGGRASRRTKSADQAA